MAIFLGAQGENILASRGVAELVAEIRALTAKKRSELLPDEGIALLKAFQERLEEETAFEERIATEFGRAAEALEHAAHEEDFISLLTRFNQLARDYFRERGSVVAVHTLCNAYRDGLVRKALQRTEESLELDGMGRPPAPYCWLVSGSAGRLEQTFCVDSSSFLISGDVADAGPGYFDEFASRAAAFMEKVGLLPGEGSAPEMNALWRGNRKEWRKEIVENFLPRERKGLAELLGRADLRLIHGDAALAEETVNVVRSMLAFHPGELKDTTTSLAMASMARAALSFPVPALREMGKRIAETPTGLDFFGRLKVEKTGRQRGRFDLEQYALVPLITNIRMLAIEYELAETGTIARIKRLQSDGRLSVDLAERLLGAYHEFTRLKLLRQIDEGCESERTCCIDPHTLSEDEDQRLRAGLETVSDLEKIAYRHFTEQG